MKKKIYGLVCISLSCFAPAVFGFNPNSFELTNLDIQSVQHCPARNTNKVELGCKAYRQTTTYTCGPAAAMAVMHYYGKLSLKDFNRDTEMRISKEMGAAEGDFGGTTLHQVASWLEGHGFNVDDGSPVSVDMIIDNINKKIPTIVSANQHWLVAKGYSKGSTPDQDEITFADSCCDVSTMTRQQINSLWGASQLAENHCNDAGQYIVATPANP
jgi:hypothetical protein